MNDNKFLLPFIDLSLNIALLLAVLFITVFLLISNRAEDHGQIKVDDSFLITLKWKDGLKEDIDLHVLGPDGKSVSYMTKDVSWGTLERDDLGINSDFYTVNNITYKSEINREVIHLRNIAPGTYVVNIQFYSANKDQNIDEDQELEIEFLQLKPDYNVVYTKKLPIKLHPKQEYTVFTFEYVSDSTSINIDTRTQIPFVLRQQQGQLGGGLGP